MKAEILSISSMPRNGARDWEAETMLSGFTKALAVVQSLSGLRTAEQRTAVENWAAAECGKLSASERDALFKYFNWEGQR
jgi:hypothetical protein